MDVRLACAVQHHASRAAHIPALLAALAPLPAAVVTDPAPDEGPANPWRTYLACLQAMPADATHYLIAQDDCVPCPGFAEAAVAAITARPLRPVAFFVGNHTHDSCGAMRLAAKAGRSWTELSSWNVFPCVAAAWPAELVHRIVAWSAREKTGRCDDGNLARFLADHRITGLATVPSLVEHPDTDSTWRTARKSPPRVACVHVGDRDASLIDWT